MRAIWIALSLWLFSNSGWADIQPPEDVIKQAAGNILTVLEQDRRLIEDHPQYLYQTLLDELMPISNDYLIGKKVLGKYWKRLSAAQRERFKSGYRNKMLATYEAVLRRYDDQKVIYKPAVIEDDKHYARVDSIVIRPGKEPFLISYRLSFSRDKWRLFDVIMDGVSMNAATRDQLREEIKESGLSQTISRLYKDHPDPRQELVFGVSIWEPYVDPQLSGHGPIPSLITGIYSKLGYKVKMLIQPGQRLLDGIKNDTLDGLMVVWNPQQMTGMKFTQPYLTSSLSLVKRESDSHKYSLKDGLLTNESKARLGVHKEASNALPMTQLEKAFDVEVFDQCSFMLRNVMTKTLDVALVDTRVALDTIAQNDKLDEHLALITPAVEEFELYAAITNDHPAQDALISGFNVLLSRFQQNGEAANILQKFNLPTL